jgi:NADH-quinone oxidoreductase subunit A
LIDIGLSLPVLWGRHGGVGSRGPNALPRPPDRPGRVVTVKIRKRRSRATLALLDTLSEAWVSSTPKASEFLQESGSSALREYIPLLFLIAFVVVNAVGMVIMSHMMTRPRPTPVKRTPYESGMPPLGDTRDRFSVKFYLVAMLFIVFDIETVFMIPWAVTFRQLGLFGLIEMLVFILILLVGYVYAWKRGALEWD